jgi:hypothetical protein
MTRRTAVKPHAPILALAGFTVLALSACNIFDPLDSPTSDVQRLSAARACFDKGDIECARTHYAALSNDMADIRNSEEAFLALEAVNAGMGAFIRAFGSGDSRTGAAITSVANSIGSNASRATRVAIFAAYVKANSVTDTRLKGLGRFVTSLALASAYLAETAATKGDLRKSDLAANATACQTAGSGGCAAATTDCAAGATPIALATTTIAGDDLSNATEGQVDTAALGLEVFNAAVNTINLALTDMGVATTSANVAGFSDVFANIPGATTQYEQCYRSGMLEQGVGR